MPRIRKKTSNRGTTRDRAKIHKKVVDGKKKVRKAAKKDPTWKSKKKADPGIPNSFHLKDQVLAELAEEKRRSDEVKALQRGIKSSTANVPNEENEEDNPGITSILSSVIPRSTSKSAAADIGHNDDENEEETDVPDLVDTHLATLQDTLDKSDLILQVVDARDIAGGRSGYIENLVMEAEGRVVLLVNKIDLVPREILSAWLSHLPKNTLLYSTNPPPSTPTPAPTSSSNSASSSSKSKPLGHTQLLSTLHHLANTSGKPAGEYTIALMGLPNTGKTSILNSLLPLSKRTHAVAAQTPLSKAAKHPAPTTLAPVEVVVDLGEGMVVRVVDTPGWEFADEEEEEEGGGEGEGKQEEKEGKWDEMEERVAGDLLRRNLGRVDRVKDVTPLVEYIISRSNPQDLMLAYNVPYFLPGDVRAFLTGLARVSGRVRKHGDPDLDSTSRIILRDWATGQFPYYTLPPAGSGMAVDLEQGVKEVLEGCKGKKEMRKGNEKGLIRFRGGEVDLREVILDDDYTAGMGAEDDDEDEEDDEEEVEGGDDGDEDEDGDEEGDDEVEEDDDEEEALIMEEGEGETLNLESGSEPASGSDPEPNQDEDEQEEDEEEEEEEEEQEPEPISILKKRKRASIGGVPGKKAKRVSFGGIKGKGVQGAQKGVGGKRKR